MKNRIITGFMIGILCLGTLCGCGGNQEGNVGEKTENRNSTSEEQNSPEDKIDIDDFKFEPTTIVENGDRYVVLKLTNNSDYAITGFALSYKLKSDVTEQQKEEVYQEIGKSISAKKDEMEKIKENEIKIHAYAERLIDVGETCDKLKFFYLGGGYYIRKMEHLQLGEPDIATIKFIDQGKVYTVNYDFANDVYSCEDDVEEANQWSTKEIGEKIPKIEAKYIKTGLDNDDFFSFDAYGLTMKDFDAYVDECKKMGYTEDVLSSDGFYSADNKDGYDIRLHFEEYNSSIDGIIDAPQEE